MARIPRSHIVLPGHPHHIVIRGNNRRTLFSYNTDRDHFLWGLGRAARNFGCRLHHIALLDNHVHLVALPPTLESLTGWMKVTLQRYAVYRNARRGGSGKLFEQRFWAKPIRTELQMAVTAAYVDLNIVRAGITGPKAQWSTLHLHSGEPARSRIPEALWQPSDWYQALGKNTHERARAYLGWLGDYLEHRDDLHWFAQIAPDPVDHRQRVERPDRTSAR